MCRSQDQAVVYFVANLLCSIFCLGCNCVVVVVVSKSTMNTWQSFHAVTKHQLTFP
jgi:hypothetical protein